MPFLKLWFNHLWKGSQKQYDHVRYLISSLKDGPWWTRIRCKRKPFCTITVFPFKNDAIFSYRSKQYGHFKYLMSSLRNGSWWTRISFIAKKATKYLLHFGEKARQQKGRFNGRQKASRKRIIKVLFESKVESKKGLSGLLCWQESWRKMMWILHSN